MHRNPNDYLAGQKRAYLTNLKPTLELVKSFEYFLYEQVFSSNGVIPFLDDVPVLHSLRTPKKLYNSSVFRERKMDTLARNGLLNLSFFNLLREE